MTLRERIGKHLQSIGPDALCDSCLAKVHIDRSEAGAGTVNNATRRLAWRWDFERTRAECASCDRRRMVTRHRRP